MAQSAAAAAAAKANPASAQRLNRAAAWPACIAALRGHSAAVVALAATPAGAAAARPLLASGGADGGVRVWDFKTGEAVASLVGHLQPVVCVAFVEEGERLISVSR